MLTVMCVMRPALSTLTGTPAQMLPAAAAALVSAVAPASLLQNQAVRNPQVACLMRREELKAEGPLSKLARPRSHAEPIWDNKYFYIADNSGQLDVKILIRSCWTSDPRVGMGRSQMSRTLAPAHYGESRDNPVRSLMLLRAWMLWRVHLNSWTAHERSRKRQLEEDQTILEQYVRQLRARGGLLGNVAADNLFSKWVPSLVARLLASPVIALSSDTVLA